ncbi:hypothetical protein PG989_012540 [Apiospora arundinis]
MQFTSTVVLAFLSALAAAAPAPASTCNSTHTKCRDGVTNNDDIIACDETLTHCVGHCLQEQTLCAFAPDANMSFCAAQYVGCSGLDVTTLQSCEAQDETCRFAPDANMSFCGAQKARCTGFCDSAYDECRVAPDANMSFCASKYANCLGRNPF